MSCSIHQWMPIFATEGLRTGLWAHLPGKSWRPSTRQRPLWESHRDTSRPRVLFMIRQHSIDDENDKMPLFDEWHMCTTQWTFFRVAYKWLFYSFCIFKDTTLQEVQWTLWFQGRGGYTSLSQIIGSYMESPIAFRSMICFILASIKELIERTRILEWISIGRL